MLPKVNHFYLCEILLSLPLIFHEIITAVIALSHISKIPSIRQWNTTNSPTDSKQQWMDLEWNLRMVIILIVISCYSKMEKQFLVPYSLEEHKKVNFCKATEGQERMH